MDAVERRPVNRHSQRLEPVGQRTRPREDNARIDARAARARYHREQARLRAAHLGNVVEVEDAHEATGGAAEERRSIASRKLLLDKLRDGIDILKQVEAELVVFHGDAEVLLKPHDHLEQGN